MANTYDYIIAQRATFDIEIEFNDGATPPVVIPVPAEFVSGKAEMCKLPKKASSEIIPLAVSLASREDGLVVVTISDEIAGAMTDGAEYQIDCLLDRADGTRSRPMKIVALVDLTVTR